MGWLFAVSLGLQDKSGGAVIRAIPPLALGHLLSMGAVFAVVSLLQLGGSQRLVKLLVGCVLVGFGLARMIGSRHPRWARWTGMRVGFRDLAIWSFLMASGHGAGLMVLPVMLAFPDSHSGHVHPAGPRPPWILAATVHTLGYLAVTAIVGFVVYRYVGLAFLRRAWINVDVLWGGALILSGIITFAV
jgi:hypothetical protein